MEVHKKAVLASSENEEKRWKAVEKSVEQDILRRNNGQLNPLLFLWYPSGCFYGTLVADGWAGENTESYAWASTSAYVQQASGAMLPVWHDGAPEMALPKAGRSTVTLYILGSKAGGYPDG